METTKSKGSGKVECPIRGYSLITQTAPRSPTNSSSIATPTLRRTPGRAKNVGALHAERGIGSVSVRRAAYEKKHADACRGPHARSSPATPTASLGDWRRAQCRSVLFNHNSIESYALGRLIRMDVVQRSRRPSRWRKLMRDHDTRRSVTARAAGTFGLACARCASACARLTEPRARGV